MTKQPKGIYTSNAIPVKLSMAFLTELEKIFHSLYGNTKHPEANIILRNKNGTGGVGLPDFRLYYKALVIKIVW